MKEKLFTAFAFLIFFLVMTVQVFCQSIKVPLGTEPGSPYGYWITRPDSAKNLLFFFHGHGERGNGSSLELDRVSKIGIQKLIASGKWTRKDFVVISPQYPVTADKMAPKTLHGFILKKCADLGISTDRVYLVGISGGAITLLNYIANYPTAKAAVSISGGGPNSLAYNATNTKLWMVHGEEDSRILYTDAIKFQLAYNKTKPPNEALFTLVPLFGHDAALWDKVCSNDKFYNWMLK